jgi:hypothetical protein
MMTASELMSRLNEAANTIARGSVRGSANYIVASKEVSDYLNNIDSKAKERKIKIKRILKDE